MTKTITDFDVKAKIIKVGQKRHLDELIDDPNPAIRKLVAKRGFKEHLDKLIGDKDLIVRAGVAESGNYDHLKQLAKDPSEYVRSAVARRNNLKINDILVKDPNSIVRAGVASVTTDPSHIQALHRDSSPAVRWSLTDNENTPLWRVKDIALHDPDEDTQYGASINYHHRTGNHPR